MKDDHILTPAEAQAYQKGWTAAGLLPIWTIYNHPTDYPLSFVARPGLVGKIEGQDRNEHMVMGVLLAATHEELIEALPIGLTRLPRREQDEPQIVETWF